MLFDTTEHTEAGQQAQEPPSDEGPPPYELHQTFQLVPQLATVGFFNQGAMQPNAGVNTSNPTTPDALSRCLSRFDLTKDKQVGHSMVAILLFLTTIMVMLTANVKTGEEKTLVYETLAMNSVAFMMIYFTTRIPIKQSSTYYTINRAIEIVGIGISVFLFLASILMYINVASSSNPDNSLVLAIIFLGCAFAIEVLVLFMLIYDLRLKKIEYSEMGVQV